MPQTEGSNSCSRWGDATSRGEQGCPPMGSVWSKQRGAGWSPHWGEWFPLVPPIGRCKLNHCSHWGTTMMLINRCSHWLLLLPLAQQPMGRSTTIAPTIENHCCMRTCLSCEKVCLPRIRSTSNLHVSDQRLLRKCALPW